MKIATWNVNSIRTRLEQVVGWLQANPVEVLCLQETKVIDQDFPLQVFTNLGYNCYISGQKSYNGVAILSRFPLQDVSTGFTPVLGSDWVDNFDDQKRLITGIVNNIRIVCLYIPNGSEVGSEKYFYKLHWLKLLQNYLKAIIDKSEFLCICGDFNIAPDDRDIHKPTAYKERIMCSTAERQALQQIVELGFSDAFRKFTDEGGHFSWWDYRSGSFQRNWGWRIDHHFLNWALYERAKSCVIDKSPRELPKPSDHTPVIVEF